MKKTRRATKTLVGVLALLLIFAIAGHAVAQTAIRPPSGLVAWWPGDGNTHDLIGGNDATLQNHARLDPGFVGQAFSLDGVDDFVSIPNSATLNPTNAITLDAWVFMKGYTYFPEIVGKGNCGWLFDQSYGLGITSPEPGWPLGHVVFLVNRDGTLSGRGYVCSENAIPLNTWTHVAGTYDGATLKVFVNGSLVGSVPYSGHIHSTPTYPVLIGKAERAGDPTGLQSSFFNGLIDEVDIFDRALSDSEVRAIFNAGHAGKSNLEKEKGISITYYVAPAPPFRGAVRQIQTVRGGAKWKATRDTYGWDLEFQQKGGKILFKYSYPPCEIADLGAGDLDSYLDVDPKTLKFQSPWDLEAHSGHVYLLNQGAWKHWVLFTWRFDSSGAGQMAPQPRPVQPPGGAPPPEVPVRTLTGHSGDVFWVMFSPDGKLLATAGHDFTARLWNLATCQQRSTLTGHTERVVRMAVFAPDGKALATCSEDGLIKVWDVTTEKELFTLKGHTDKIWSVAFAPDGKTLASASCDRTVKVWDTATGAPIATLTGHTSVVECVVLSPDGKWLVSGSWDGTFKLWDTATWEEKTTVRVNGHVQCLAFSPDSKTLAIGHAHEGWVTLWDVASSRALHILAAHQALLVQALAFSPDSKTLASSGRDGMIKFWDVQTGRETAGFHGHSTWVWSVAFSPDGRTLASASRDRTVKLWDVARLQSQFRGQLPPRAPTPEPACTLARHDAPVKCLAFSPDGKTLASASFDLSVRLWDLATRQQRAILTAHDDGRTGWVHTQGINAATFSPDGKILALAGGDGLVKLWDAAGANELRTLRGHSAAVTALSFRPDGKTLASASDDRTVKLWELATGSVRATLSGHRREVMGVVFSSDGRLLVSAGKDWSVKIWETATGNEKITLPVQGEVYSLACSPNDRSLAAGCALGPIVLWHLGERVERFRPEPSGRHVFGLAFSPDSKILAAASLDGIVKLFDATTGRQLAAFRADEGGTWAVTFAPDGKTLATAGEEQTVKLWDLNRLIAGAAASGGTDSPSARPAQPAEVSYSSTHGRYHSYECMRSTTGIAAAVP